MSATQRPEMKNLILAVALSTAVLVGWQFFIEQPKRDAAIKHAQEMKALNAQKGDVVLPEAGEEPATHAGSGSHIRKLVPRSQRLKTSERVKLDTGVLHGSVNLTGMRVDDLTLARYRETLDPKSREVTLLSPTGGDDSYLMEFGWLAGTKGTAVPSSDTLWQTDAKRLGQDRSLSAQWDNGEGLTFEQQITAQDDYLFSVEQTVTNRTQEPVTLYPYGLISRSYQDQGRKHYGILHEGPVGVANQVLTEASYQTLREEGKQQIEGKGGWIGITDKYWLAAMIPGKDQTFNAGMTHYVKDGQDRYQVDFRGQAVTVAPGESLTVSNQFFAGAKEVSMLDKYAKAYDIPLFDRAVDFGMLYFLTKPIFIALNYFYGLLGNFGLAIMLLTVCIRLLLFPLANKSYAAMGQLKQLMPKITQIKERYADDKIKMNQEIMELYKREKVNPASGCLPMLLQLPVFFALYKVLFVTIEMRHAPFYGWIHDLSAPDPTTLFNLFGLIDWSPPHFLMIGVWPLVMAGTMAVQQMLNPKPTDPAQAMVMKWLPLIFLFLFASFPAGLVIYWAWNNLLSILQQWIITRRFNRREA